MTSLQSLTLSALFRGSLVRRLLLPSILLVLLVTALAGAARVREIEQEQAYLTQGVSQYLALYLRSASEFLGHLKGSASRFENMGDHLHLHEGLPGYFEQMLVLDSQGKVVASEPQGPVADYSNIMALEQDKRPGRLRLTSPFLSLLSGEVTMALYQPMEDGHVVVGHLNLANLQSYLDAISQRYPGNLVFVVDRFGNLIAYPDQEMVDQQANLGHVPAIARALSVPSGFSGLGRLRGRLGFYSTARVEPAEWMVVVAQPAIALFGPIVAVAVAIGLLIVIMLAVLVWMLKRRLERFVVSPLGALAGRMADVESGSGEPGPESLDVPPFLELDVLQERFHSMVATIARRERELRESEQRMELALRGADLGTWDWNVATGHAKFNERWTGMLGYAQDEIEHTSETWKGLMHPEDHDLVLKILDTHLKGESGQYEIEHRLRHKSGDWVWVLSTGRVIERDRDGGPVRMCGTHMDITERKRVEENLRQTRKLLDDVQGLGNLGGWEYDPATGQAVWTENLFHLLGYEPGEFQDTHTFFMEHILHPDDRDRIMGEFADLFVDRKKISSEFRAVRKDGQVRVFQGVVAPELDADGQVVRVYGSNLDITERKRMEQELVKARDEAESASRSKSEFLATMSHEIRTPLNGVLGMLQLLQEDGAGADRELYLDSALSAGRNLLRILNDILDLSMVEAGRLKLATEDFTIHDVMDPVVGSLEGEAVRNGLELACRIDPAIPGFLRGDAGRVRQILFNLVGNSIKFTAQGKVEVEASLLPPHSSGRARLLFTVSDTGPGIPEHMVGEIFKPFTQVDGSLTRKHHGAGLGLSIVSRLVRLLGGSLSLETGEGEGAVFHVCLSFDIGRAREGEAAEPSARPAAERENAPLNVLVVEDEPVNRLMLVKLLESRGHRVTAVVDGTKVVPALRAERFHCVLMDIQMPRLDGIQATELVRRDDSGEFDTAIPVIALTAHAMDGDRRKFLESGMDGYLSKPVEMAALDEVLGQVVGQGAPEAAD